MTLEVAGQVHLGGVKGLTAAHVPRIKDLQVFVFVRLKCVHLQRYGQVHLGRIKGPTAAHVPRIKDLHVFVFVRLKCAHMKGVKD